MKKALYALSAATAALVMAPAATATNYPIALSFDVSTYTAGFDASPLSGFFSDTFNFTSFVPTSFGDYSLGNVGCCANLITFSRIEIDGMDLLPYLVVIPRQAQLQGATGLFIPAGLHSLLVEGMAGGNASYSGTVNFTIAAIPEPASWALMVGGIAAVGAAMRRRARTLSVAFG